MAMVIDALEKAYRKVRAGGRYPARWAIDSARAEVAEAQGEPIDLWERGSCDFGAWREGPLLVVVKIAPDEYPDHDSPGRFSDRWEPGAVKHSGGRRGCRWWIPNESLDERAAAYRSPRLHYLGYSKQAARERAALELREDYLRACNPPAQYVISAKVYLSDQDPDDLLRWANHFGPVDGPLLGSAALGGVYYPVADSDLRFVADDALAEAEEAIAKIKTLPQAAHYS